MKTNVIYRQDNVEGLREHIPDNSIDLTVTSPPYDELRDYEGYEWDFKELVKELYRVTKRGGVVVWIVGDETKDFCETLSSFKQAIYFVENANFKLLDTMIYLKENYPPAYPNLRRYANQFEYMFVFVKGEKPKTFNPIEKEKVRNREERVAYRQKDGSLKRKIKKITDSNKKQATNVWSYSVGGSCTKDEFAYEHPAMFPEQLAKDHIKSWSNENDIVLDPFMGSGTTAKMAEILNRKWIGFEISQEYVNLAYKRVGKVDKKYYDNLPKDKKPKQTQLF